MNQKNRNIYLFSLMILTAVLISFLYLSNLKIGLILIIASIPISIYSIYFGIKDYRNFFLEKTEQYAAGLRQIIDKGFTDSEIRFVILLAHLHDEAYSHIQLDFTQEGDPTKYGNISLDISSFATTT